MNKNTVITAITTKLFIVSLLLLTAVAPAFAQTSMIPDDFDWGIYIQGWGDDDWYGWGSSQYQNYSYNYQEPITYDWYGQTYTMNFYDPTPVPQNNFWDNDYVPSQTYSPPAGSWNDDGWTQVETVTTEIDDGWFYQLEQGWYDDFSSWSGHQNLPESAFVSGFVGYEQSYNLDCEARSAVDFAAWFGVNINHAEFLYSLPKSDDPNVGFVGSWTDARGHIPPASYGVYQEPVAALLRGYGLNATGVYAYTEEALKAQIAAGKPVMVWVVGNVEIGYAVPYTPASTGNTTYVVPYQHTVVVTGYDADAVYIQDGALRYTRDWNTFLLSWGALGDRAIYVN